MTPLGRTLASGRLLAGAALAGLLFGPVHGQIPPGWELKTISTAGPGYYDDRPDINDRGQIVFHRLSTVGDRRRFEIMLYDRGRLIPITQDDVYDAAPRINNLGDIVWNRDLDPDPRVEHVGIVMWRDGQMAVLFEPPDGFDYFTPDINDAGQITWRRTPRDRDDDILLFDGVEVRELDSTDSLTDDGPVINSHGDVVFTRYDYSVGPGWLAQIVAWIDGQTEYLTDNLGRPSNPSINDSRLILWRDADHGIIARENGSNHVLLENTLLYSPQVANGPRICVNQWNPPEGAFSAMVLDGDTLWRVAPGRGFADSLNARGETAITHGPSRATGIGVLTKAAFPADLDTDGDVDLGDFSLYQRCAGLTGGEATGACLPADVNADLRVDSADFLTFLGSFQGPT